jgi:hypothetical protein
VRWAALIIGESMLKKNRVNAIIISFLSISSFIITFHIINLFVNPSLKSQLFNLTNSAILVLLFILLGIILLHSSFIYSFDASHIGIFGAIRWMIMGVLFCIWSILFSEETLIASSYLYKYFEPILLLIGGAVSYEIAFNFPIIRRLLLRRSKN